jgi:uncharacterized protein (TIGR03790 family)
MTNEECGMTNEARKANDERPRGARRSFAIRHLAALFLLITPARALSPSEVLVIYNPSYPHSEELAQYYAQKRGIPPAQVIGFECATSDEMSRADFDRQLRAPLRKTLVSKGWWKIDSSLKAATHGDVASSSIRALAIMQGVPFRIARDQQNPEMSREDEASVDSELAALSLVDQKLAGALKNAYFQFEGPVSHFTASPGFLLVGRLDGPSDVVVRRMIDDALYAEQNGLHGRAVIDLAKKNEGGYIEGEQWLQNIGRMYQRGGIPFYIDREEPVVPDHWPLPDTILYFGWYTGGITGALASPGFRFQRGAVACHIHSFSAGVLRADGQAWTGPLLHKGAAAALGNVYEPFLSLTTHLDLFNQRLLEGYTFAEAAWNATPAISWMNVAVGDPLYRPFAKTSGSGGLGNAESRDYLLYQGAAKRSPLDPDAAIKTTITAIAEKRKSARLLELTALLSMHQERHAEAGDLFDHAEALVTAPADRLRLRLYRAECLRRDDKGKTAAELLKSLLKQDIFDEEPARAAAEALLRELGG